MDTVIVHILTIPSKPHSTADPIKIQTHTNHEIPIYSICIIAMCILCLVYILCENSLTK